MITQGRLAIGAHISGTVIAQREGLQLLTVRGVDVDDLVEGLSLESPCRRSRVTGDGA